MNAISHHPGRVAAIGVVIAVALMALLPGSWVSAQSTAGTPTPLTSCAADFTLTDAGTCVKTVTNTPQTFTVQTSGQTTTLGGLANGGTVEVVIPPTYPAGAQLAIQTTSTITVDGNGQTTTVSEVVSIQCTGNCDGTPVLFRMNLQSVIGFTDFSCAALQLADDCQAFFVTGLDSAASLGTSNGYHAISFGIVTGETAPASGPEQAAPTAVLARILPGGIIEGDLPPGNWGIEFQAPPADVGPGQVTTPAPADTGMGAATESGATDTMAIVLGLVALAGILGVGARFALARRQA